MNDKVKAALARVAARLQALSKEDFQSKIHQHSTGEFALALLENYSQANSHTVLSFRQFCMKISQSTFLEQEVLDFELRATEEAANDDSYLMAA
jgi:hypothetical protein